MGEEAKKTSQKKTSSTKKPTSKTNLKTTKSSQQKSKSATKKPVAKTQSKSIKTSKNTTDSSKKVSTQKTSKPTSKPLKKDEKSINLSSKDVKVVKKKPTTKKKVSAKKPQNKRVKKKENLTTLEVMEQKIEGKEIVEKEPLGKTFYLVFSIVFYVIAFFYINNVYFSSGDLLQSALFAFAALFIAFVLMLFNIHRIFISFFILPFRRLVKQAKQEVSKEIFFSVGKNKIQTTINKYRTIFTLVLYIIIAGVLLYANIRDGFETDETILQTIGSILVTELVYVIVLCSWQYMFNIIPEVLDKSIDAKNGYILTLSAIVMVIYVVFNIFNVVYLSEIMIFVLIIGFIALLGVNLNMIVGEINIFSNLRGKHDKSVTRIVFAIFFTFHIYVIIYASVVAYSIYLWDNNSYTFSSNPTQTNLIMETYQMDKTAVPDDIYYWDGIQYSIISTVYDDQGTELTEFYDENYNPVWPVYDQAGQMVQSYYGLMENQTNGYQMLDMLQTENGTMCITNSVFFMDGTLNCFADEYIPHEYSDFLYWTVISVSTIGYGDVSPSTEYPIAMGWGAFLGIYGLTFFALSISYVSNIAMEGLSSRKED